MAKRKPRKTNTVRKKARKKTQRNKSNLKIINIVLLILIVTLVTSIASYFFLLKDEKKELKPTIEKKVEIKKDLDLNNYANKKIEKYFMDDSNNLKYEEYTKEFDKEYIHKKQKDSKKSDKQTNKVVKQEKRSEKPKLVVIIDDVTLQRQVDKILDIGYKITMSFLPPTKQHPHSAKVAKGLPFYMIHFPMQAQSFKFEEENTLHVGDSYERIEKRVRELKKAYPDAIYTNNHTGSKFTSDEKSMDYLFKALKKYNLIFVDSRTTSKTVAKKYAKKYEMPYIARNIFIDNKKDFNYIQTQLKKAIKISKKSGYSIAIGHPYSITLKVLKESKHLLKDLELIYLSELPFLPKP
ncbi:hypothetical protein CP960_02405 [Malaciobacter halophilus]|uniref:Divergent polysaccharide deacetylase family protein n=1 Tax=Malaciobacter halophilus TaxID=197482 RepID=A0A2N1J5A2_9BACT|nr:divergent polysaccharide deacetylase family protein [Malaciobacter halophilus]AXH10722.1 divergent polysaccharide deacetylase [Malaciobacter halophilus]PKI81745.1 hypothetical protein CP960_02405 [Malaciobacter halophilus]